MGDGTDAEEIVPILFLAFMKEARSFLRVVVPLTIHLGGGG